MEEVYNRVIGFIEFTKKKKGVWEMGKSYLGDSVYARFEGLDLILTTENGILEDPSNTIVLEYDVLQALLVYVKKILK